MARPLRLTYPGALYHVTARGNARQPIYLADEDRRLFLAVLAQVVERCAWRCHAYCLMDNHYHLLIETPRGNLSVGMRHVNGIYTQRFNRRHGRVGHLFQGRFKAILVERESYLLELCRYVVLNPVRAGVVKRPESYSWSSYRATAGLEPPPQWLSRDWLLAQLSSRRAVAERKYRQFVQEGLGASSPWAQVHGQAVLGQSQFIERLQPLLVGKAEEREIPRVQRFLLQPALDKLLSAQQVATRARRNQAIWAAHMQHGYSLTTIGQYLGLHTSTISKIVQQRQTEEKFSNFKT
jgi:REP element-mobilizing transposase RayT